MHKKIWLQCACTSVCKIVSMCKIWLQCACTSMIKKNVCIMIWMLLEMFRFFVCLMVSQFLLLIIKLVHHARCTLYILEVPELQLYTGASCSLNVRVNFCWAKLIVHPHVLHIFSFFLSTKNIIFAAQRTIPSFVNISFMYKKCASLICCAFDRLFWKKNTSR